jgi:hypothetical protein
MVLRLGCVIDYMMAQFHVAERFALPACGRAWTMLESRKNSKPEKCSKMPQNPTRQVHALLGTVLFNST